MPQKNHLKTPNEDTLKGTGKLGWSESGKLHGTIKRIVSTFDEENQGHTNARKKRTVKCPGCNRKFRSNNGKVPAHKSYSWMEGSVMCSQKKSLFQKPTIIGKVDTVIINEYEIYVGDHVAFTTYPFTVSFVEPHELKEYTIEKLLIMDNNKIYMKLVGIDQEIPAYMFARNFIKL